MFGSNVFTKSEMQARMPKSAYKSVVATIDKGAKLDPAVADAIAAAMKDWALEKGATHYARSRLLSFDRNYRGKARQFSWSPSPTARPSPSSPVRP